MYRILAVIAIITKFYFFVVRSLEYWSRKGVSQRSAYGQFKNIVRQLLQLDVQAENVKTLFDEFPDKRYTGAYRFLRPVLFLRDPELIKQITIKDFDYFTDHMQFVPEDVEPLWGKNLFALTGDRWREMRATLSPSFTSSKMRAIFTLMDECAQQFVSYFKNNKEIQAIEMRDAITRYANDVIATTAFGVTCDSLKYPNNEFYLMGKEISNVHGLRKNVKFFLTLIAPTPAKMLGYRMFPKNVCEFFTGIVKTNIETREKYGIVRPDMLQVLLEARKSRMVHDKNGITDPILAAVGKKEKCRKQQISDDDITAQALVFFLAGFENVSLLIWFLLYEVSVNPNIQEKLRKEVDETLESDEGSLTYESLLKMKYLDMVVSETLRKWPFAIIVDRVCVKPYTIQPAREGESPIQVEKGDLLWLPIFGIHRNPEFYPDPERFDPERFSSENKSNIKPYTYMPFGMGPRVCIGDRFTLLETKTIVCHILSNFEVLLSESTPGPVKISKDQFNLAPENGILFRLKPREL